METKIITAADLKDGEYAATNSIDFDGNLVIEGGLGRVRFRGFIRASGQILAKVKELGRV